MRISHNSGSVFYTEYADQTDNTPPADDAGGDGTDQPTDDIQIVIPEDLSTLDDDALANLMGSAKEAFAAVFGEDQGASLSDEGLEALSVLTDGIKRLQGETQSRSDASAKRAKAASALAEEAGIDFAAKDEGVSPADGGPEDEAAKENAGLPNKNEKPDVPGDPEAVDTSSDPDSALAKKKDDGDEDDKDKMASDEGPREIRVNLAGLASKGRAPAMTTPVESTPARSDLQVKDLLHAGSDLQGATSGEGITIEQLAAGLDRNLASLNVSQWESAMAAERPMRHQQSLAVLKKPFTEDMILRSNSETDALEMIRHATDESRLEGGSLVAAGGWCAPSEVIYDLFEVETRDGLFSMPEINVARGGINITPGPDFSALYAGPALGFEYTEANDIAGNYAVDANGLGTGSAGTKPCYHVTCPTFAETRLGFDGLCLTAGLLQQRGYPEIVARTVRGALVAHDHRIAGRVLAKMIAGSTAVTMGANQVGATAPILTAIEVQVEHYRTVSRISRGASLEAIFPFWVKGAIRSDLSRRQGVDFINVPDSLIDTWFRDRGISPQFVYNFNDLTGAATAALSWPTSVNFLMYAAGTWVKGAADIITLDTLYDSVNLGKNDFTALFTEEGYLVAKAGHDSRYINVNICPDGATHGGVSIACDGTQSGTAQV